MGHEIAHYEYNTTKGVFMLLENRDIVLKINEEKNSIITIRETI